MNQDNKSPNWGGARPGAGRPKGSGNKIKIEDLIDAIEHRAGVSYPEQIAENYIGAIAREDWSQVQMYDRALLNKIVADKTEVEVTDSATVIETRRQAFAEAIAQIAGINKEQ